MLLTHEDSRQKLEQKSVKAGAALIPDYYIVISGVQLSNSRGLVIMTVGSAHAG